MPETDETLTLMTVSAGATLLEFAPEQREGDCTLFANLAHHRGLRYVAVVSPILVSDRPVDRRDFHVDLGNGLP